MDFERDWNVDAAADRQQAHDPELAALAARVKGHHAQPGTMRTVTPGPDGVVVLPAGTDINQIEVDGRNLIVTLPDGTQMVILDGAVVVPHIVVGDVEIPSVNLAALLIGQEPQPAAGPPRSSGGNFLAADGDVGDPHGLGDLLPPTELQFTQVEEREILPIAPSSKPEVIIVTPDQPAGAVDATSGVSETGLPARGEEPAGTAAATDSERTSGTIEITAQDGLAGVTINGEAITAVGQTVTTPLGVLTITSIAPGAIGYTYALSDNVIGTPPAEVFTVVVTDTDGDKATATLTISIADDAPQAHNDTDLVTAGTYGPETGNVVTGSGTTSGAAGADVSGADGFAPTGAVVGVAAGANGSAVDNVATVGHVIQGQYGVLTLNGDGSYSYVRSAGTPGGVSDSFTYTVKDGDGDLSPATLTINIGDSGSVITSVPTSGAGTVVDESGLGTENRPGESPGSDAPAPTETTAGTITYVAPDMPATVTINGVTVTAMGQQITGTHGTLTITGISPGSIDYSYTLTDNTAGDAVTDNFTIVVTDVDGDASAPATLTITIVDDVPTAHDDAVQQTAENAPVVINAFTNDVFGADGVDIHNAVTPKVTIVSGPAAGSVSYDPETGLFTFTPAAGQEGTASFVYQIEDGDGDKSQATVTVTLLPDSTPTILVAEGSDTVVDEAALNPNGSNAASDAETAAGTLVVTTGNDTVGSLFVNNVDVTTGGTIKGAFGTLTITGSPTAGYAYSYTLETHTSGTNTHDDFAITVTDSDGDPAATTLTIAIIDDKPQALPDTDAVAAGSFAAETGNVITGVGTTSGATGADVLGADGAGAHVTFGGSIVNGVLVQGSGQPVVSGGSAVIHGQYGDLTLFSNGEYSYTRAADTPGGVDDKFVYVLADSDGSTSPATLTISVGDAQPVVTVPEAGGDTTTVYEQGLPARTGESEGSGEQTASGPNGDTSESVTGTVNFHSADGVQSLTVAGVALDPSLFPQTVVDNATGTLVINGGSYDEVTGDGSFSYTYTLKDNTSGDHTNVSFAVVLTDQDGDPASSDLVINIVDDAPHALPDTDTVAAGSFVPESGNVITGVGTTSGAAGVDIPGADGARVSFGGSIVNGVLVQGSGQGVASGGSAIIHGQYGDLQLFSDGSYNYTRATGTPGGVEDKFVYVLLDGDGDTSPSTLTISIDNSTPTVTTPVAGGETTTVYEQGLPARGGESEGSGEQVAPGINGDASEGVTGTVTFHSADGVQSLTVAGVALDPSLFPQTVVDNATGTLVINGGSYDEVTGDGSFSYTYTLKDNTSGDHTNVSFSVVLTDPDGDPASSDLVINIVDDTPHAVDDSGYVAPEDTPITIDALHNDIFGADGVDIHDATKVTIVTGPLHGSVSYDATTGLFTYTPDTVTQATPDSFTYQIVDGDGDPSTATVSLMLTPDAVPSILSSPSVTVDEDGLAGANADANRTGEVTSTGSAAATGQIVVDFFHDVPAQANALASIQLLDSNALDGQLKTLSGANVTFALEAGTGDLVGSGGGSEVIRIHIVSATVGTGADATKITYSYDVTLSQPVQHSVAGSEDSDLLNGIGFQVTDTDNSTAQGSFNVSVTDDIPIALDYASGLTFAEGSGVHDIGNATTLLGISGGADGLQGTIQQIQFTNQGSTGGTLSINGSGHLIYTAPAHVTNSSTVLETFSYTVTDRDGDPVTKTVSFSVSDTGISNVSATNEVVDEDSLPGGLTGGPGDDAAVTTGHISFTLGADALKSITLSATTGLTKLDGVTPVSTSWDATTKTLTGYGTSPSDVVFTITVYNVTSTGADYDMVLSQPVLHPGHDDPSTTPTVETSFEDNLSFTVNVSLLDADNSPGSTNFQITIDDSSPRASNYSGATFAEGSGAHDIGTAITVLGIQGGADGLQGSVQQIVFTNQGSTGGTLAIDGSGHLIYTAPASVSSSTTVTETFSYTVTDKDGDAVTKTVSFGVSDTGVGPVSASNASVDEDNIVGAGGIAGGPGDLTTPSPTGHISFTLGADALQSITLSAGATGLTKLDGTPVNTVWNGADTLIGYGGANQSDVVFTIKLTNIGSTGADYTVVLNQPIQHPGHDDPSTTPAVETTFEDNLALTVNVSVKDADNSENHTSFTVTINDDSPVAAVAVSASASLSIDETPGVDADSDDVTGPLAVFAGVANPGTDPNMPAGYAQQLGMLTSVGSATGADGGTIVLSLGLSSQGVDSGLNTTEGADILLYKEGDLVVGRVGGANGQAAFAIAVTASGDLQMVQYLSIQHSDTNSVDESVSIATNALVATVTVTDGDHDVATTSTPIGNLISFQDDGPTAIAPQAIVVQNSAAAPTVTAWLDSDHNVVNNYGADGGTVRFQASLDGTDSGLTSNFQHIIYDVQNSGQTLVGYTEDPSTHAQTTIFTITLDPANGEYSVDMNGKLDSITTVAFNPLNNNFVGGNNSWAGFIPLNESVAHPVDNDSKDLLLTPEVNNANDGTINSTANTGGISGGASVGSTETFRVDFVTDLRGDPGDGAGDYDTAANRDHVFDGHYTVNGASALFKSSGGSTVNIATFDDPDGNMAVGDGVKEHITGITISYLGVASSLIIPTTTTTPYTVNGHTFGVTLQADGSVNVSNVAGASGSSLQGTNIAVFTADGFNSVEYHYVSGDTFQIGGFSASTLTNQPVPFTVPIQIVDGDGDAKPASLSVTANPVTPPIALDLNGDGIHYVGLNAGVTHDYGNGAVATAWVAADDGLLALQNTDGSLKIVFSTQVGETDLQGLAKTYDSNHDGILDAHDAAFASFGVWQDANSDGIVEAGEFKTLSDAGIVSLNLTSNGQVGTAAGGDVLIYGQTSYTTTDGQTHAAADVAFQTAPVSSTTEQAEVEKAQQAGFNQALLAASLVAAVGVAEAVTDPQPASAPTETAPVVTETAPASTTTVEPTSVEGDAKSLAATDDQQTHEVEQPAQQAVHGAEEQAPDHGSLSDHGAASAPASADTAQADQPSLGDHQALLAQSISLPAFDGNAAAAFAAAQATANGGATAAEVVKEALGTHDAPHIDTLLAALPGGEHAAAPVLLNPVAGEVVDSGHMAAVAAVFEAAMAAHEAMAVAHA